jgi:hypothetical protein
MSRGQKSLVFSIVISMIPVFAIGQGEPSPEITSINVIVWSDGRWEYVDSVRENYGSIIYQKPGGRPIAARQHSLDVSTTLELKDAFATFSEACAGKPVDTSGLFALTGRSRSLFFSIAAKKSEPCLQRLIEDSRRRNNPDEVALQSREGRGLSEVAGEIELKKKGGSSTVVISGGTLPSSTGTQADVARSLAAIVHGSTELTQNDIAAIDEALKKECAEQEPDDYSHQTWCVDGALAMARRTAESEGIPQDTFGEIRAACRDKWKRNFNMQNFCESDQVRSYKKLQGDL